jgi:thiamine kinase-like enzyme
VRGLLLHLEGCGFDGAPRFLDVDERGRDVLTFVAGEVPLPPYPGWAMTDRALASMGELLARFHEASASFDQGSVAGWELDWADPGGGPVVCHNDGFPENVVFRDGVAVALIDFDMAAPGRPLWDLAIATQEWLPQHAPSTRRDHGGDLDPVARLRCLAQAYGLEPAHALDLVDIIFEERAHAMANVRREVAAGNPVWVEQWRDGSEEARVATDDEWLAGMRQALVAAVS